MNERAPRVDRVLTLLFGTLVLVAVVALVRSGGARPASSCEQGSWPATEISCIAARNASVTVPFGVAGPWTTRIWLTTLDEVDVRLHPGRQVADHPPSGNVLVWLFIYESVETRDRVLHVAKATNAKPGAFIYIYHWPDLGSPPVPETMPAIHTSVGVPDFR